MSETHDLRAEERFLAAVIMSGRIERDVSSDLTGRLHSACFAAMQRLVGEGRALSTDAVGAEMIAGGVATGEAWDFALALTNTVEERDANALADHLASLTLARQRIEARRDLIRAAEADDLEEAWRAIERARSTKTGAVSSCWLSDLGDDPIGAEPPRRRFLLRREDGAGYLPASEVCLVVAHGGIGKSTMLAQLALAVASGGRLFDVLVPADPGPVAILALEDDLDEVTRRLHWASVAAWLDEDMRALAASRIRVITPPRDTVLVAPDERGVPREQPIVGELLRDLRAAGVEWRAIILDPLNRLHACDENANGAMGHVVATIERFKELPGNPAVLVAHHSSKGKDAAASRGATAIVNAARWCAHLEPNESGGVVKLDVVKSNYTAKGSPIMLTRRRDTRGALILATVEEQAAA